MSASWYGWWRQCSLQRKTTEDEARTGHAITFNEWFIAGPEHTNTSGPHEERRTEKHQQDR